MTDDGKQLEDLRNNLEKLLTCVVCLKANPGTLFECSPPSKTNPVHIICASCHADLLLENSGPGFPVLCPECKAANIPGRLQSRRNSNLEKLFQMTPTTCTNPGCTVRPIDRSQHGLECPQRNRICHLGRPNCHFNGSKFIQHALEEHNAASYWVEFRSVDLKLTFDRDLDPTKSVNCSILKSGWGCAALFHTPVRGGVQFFLMCEDDLDDDYVFRITFTNPAGNGKSYRGHHHPYSKVADILRESITDTCRPRYIFPIELMERYDVNLNEQQKITINLKFEYLPRYE